MAENVRVAVRCRPMSLKETSMGSRAIIGITDGRTVMVTNPKDPEDIKRYAYDFAYGDNSTQEQVRLALYQRFRNDSSAQHLRMMVAGVQ
jgi:hypothetical protein